jgi:hypothetical protein
MRKVLRGCAKAKVGNLILVAPFLPFGRGATIIKKELAR